MHLSVPHGVRAAVAPAVHHQPVPPDGHRVVGPGGRGRSGHADRCPHVSDHVQLLDVVHASRLVRSAEDVDFRRLTLGHERHMLVPGSKPGAVDGVPLQGVEVEHVGVAEHTAGVGASDHVHLARVRFARPLDVGRSVTHPLRGGIPDSGQHVPPARVGCCVHVQNWMQLHGYCIQVKVQVIIKLDLLTLC